jgi:hypothetical protein
MLEKLKNENAGIPEVPGTNLNVSTGLLGVCMNVIKPSLADGFLFFDTIFV